MVGAEPPRLRRPAVFLDRDGVINRSLVRNGRPYAPVALEDFSILPGVPEAIEALRYAGYLLIIVTNQPDVGAGKQSRDIVEAMHRVIDDRLGINIFEVCYHVDGDNCLCRKPKPGMILNAARAYEIALDRSWMIGDRWRDVAAGRAAGCRTVFLDYDYDEPKPQYCDVIVRSLAEAIPIILGQGCPSACGHSAD